MMNVLNILLVEDDSDDVELIQQSLSDNQVKYHMDVVRHGDQVLPFLKSSKNLPDVVVLDLNLPKMHGREVLKSVKSDPNLRNTPVVILTTSSSPQERDFCLANGAERFISKPTTIAGFNETVASILAVAAPVSEKK